MGGHAAIYGLFSLLFGSGLAFAFCFACPGFGSGGWGDFFAGLGEGGFDGFPGGVEGSLAEGEVAEIDGLATDGEAGGGFGGFEELAAAPSGVVIDFAEHGVADHVEADFVPGARGEIGREACEDDGFIGAFVVIVVTLDGDGLGRDHDACHVVLDGIDAEAGGACAFELELVFDGEVLEFIGEA